MKSFIRLGATLGLVGSTLLGTVFLGNVPVLALPEQQIKEKLDAVPVYLITNDKGIPLSRTLSEGQNGQKGGASVTDVYLSHQEAQAFITELRNVKGKDPKMEELVKSVQVTALPLGVIYQQLQQTKNQPNRLVFAFKPGDQDIRGAMDLLRQSGQKVEQFKSVPVFAVRFAPDKGYVSVNLTANNQRLIPLFLSKQDAQGLLSQVKQKNPKADIQVLEVDGVIDALQKKNDEWLKQVVLVPSQESREYIIRTQPNNAPKTPATNRNNSRPPAAPKK
ncbi:hypothetical protein LC653_02930 [Nostoc sp. CHAB 5784]|uniref:Tic22 family protein n=1 Tax=Nostoc mirabile TaxID=2907820 RepID=UPI001E4C2567|nr:Tic22 family protein [Nostoc mirabile]MCC5662915.1 hypothetical protein [Nostoc mirabile CHAB5784]